MFMAKQVMEKALEKALDKSQLPMLRRRELRLTVLRDWELCCRDAVVAYVATHEDAPKVEEGDDPTPRPFIDWITNLFPDSETLKDFLAFLVNEFLPKLFQAIVALIVAIVAL